MNDSKSNAPSSGKKIFLWLAVLALILACVPATPVPPPTFAPNDINLFIKQTADAAFIQTQTAVPTFTALPTFTSTPRNTFTPEATVTPISTFLFSTPTPIQRIQYFRVKHDSQLAIYDYRSRTATWDRRQTPEVVPLFVDSKETSGTNRTTIDRAWENYMIALNGRDAGKIDYLKDAGTALFNTSGFPNLESLTMGGNVITLDQIQGDWGRVHTFNYNDTPSVGTENYSTRPDLVHKFVVVVWNRTTKSTFWVNPPRGDIYWPLVSSRAVWIQMSRIEPFPILPMEVTAKADQEILREPTKDGAPSGETFNVGETATLVEYYPSGSKVWGRLLGGPRWIILFQYTKQGPTYPTNWSMETLPPP